MLPARFRQRVVIIVERRGPRMHDELPRSKRTEKRFDHAEREAHPVGDAAAARRPA